MGTVEKENLWKKVFDILKSTGVWALVGIGFKGITLLVQLTITFTNMQKDVSELQTEVRQLWKEKDRDVEEHKDMIRDISTINLKLEGKQDKKY